MYPELGAYLRHISNIDAFKEGSQLALNDQAAGRPFSYFTVELPK